MTAPVPGLKAADQSSAEALLGALKHVAAPELRKHATVYNYWLSIRRGREVPPIRDLDPLEISDVAPSSLLLELVNGGEDAQIRHLGAALKSDREIANIAEAEQPSALATIAGKLAAVAMAKDALAFEETFAAGDGLTRCSVTLLPFSTAGDVVDFIYGLVSVETGVTETVDMPEPVVEQTEEEAACSEPEEGEPENVEAVESVAEELSLETAVEVEPVWEEAQDDPEPLEVGQLPAAAKPGFSSKVFDALAGAKGFFGTVASAEPKPTPQAIAEEELEPVAKEVVPVDDELAPPEEVASFDQDAVSAEEPLGPIVELGALDGEELEPIAEKPVAQEPVIEEPAPEESELVAEELEPVVEEPVIEEPAPEESELVAEELEPVFNLAEPAAEQPIDSPHFAVEGTLQSKLEQVRGMAEEAHAAKLRAEAALVDGLSAAYDFALDAENAPEEYLKLVEGQGLKIQLRAPMAPVVKLAFNGSCDDPTIKRLEAVLAWALKQELPRGSLSERVAAEGGIDSILSAKAA